MHLFPEDKARCRSTATLLYAADNQYNDRYIIIGYVRLVTSARRALAI